MANITVRRGNGGETLHPRDILSPLRAWRDMFRWDPFAEMLPSLSEGERALFSPDFDVKETKDAFEFIADLPGLDAKEVDINIADNRLTISGQREQEKEHKGETVYRCERSYGAFSRAFTLPAATDTDKVSAELKNGILKVKVPKSSAAKPKQVSVKSG